MIVQIQTRYNNGKWCKAIPGDFAEAAFDAVFNIGAWSWFRFHLCRFCLRQAKAHSENHAAADLWIKRYQAIRGIE